MAELEPMPCAIVTEEQTRIRKLTREDWVKVVTSPNGEIEVTHDDGTLITSEKGKYTINMKDYAEEIIIDSPHWIAMESET